VNETEYYFTKYCLYIKYYINSGGYAANIICGIYMLTVVI
jgi:hypothetical protein